MTSTSCLAVLALALCICSVNVQAGLTVYGNCLDGAQCAGRGLEGGYPVCCRNRGQRPTEVSKLFEFGSTVYLMCRCPVTDTASRVPGTCWQGSQCNACASASMYNGHWVCCPNCASGVTLFNGRCSC